MAGTTSILGNRYTLDQLIGSGGMAQVWRATDRETGSTVAVKRLFADHLELGTDRAFRERLLREARVLEQIAHPAIIQYLDVGFDDDELPYLVVEWLRGVDLATHLEARGPLPIDQAIKITRQVLGALVAVHSAGVIHRDINPNNIFLVEGSAANVRLLDFGIALMPEQFSRLTGTGVAVGTPAYMAPEQLRGNEPTDHRCDLYALGTVLFQMATGRPPFEDNDPLSVIMKVISEPVPWPSELRPDLPRSLEEVILQAMRRAPTQRYQSAEGMLAALNAAG